MHPVCAHVAVLASGEGTTLSALLDACRSGAIDAEIALVMSNNREAGALRRAADAGLRTCHLSGRTHPDPDELDRAMLRELEAASIDWIVLAGFLKKVGPRVLSRYAGRILNTHPSLLPKFGGQGRYGRRVHEAVLAAGERVTGVSVHLVTAEYDDGPVVAQAEVPVYLADDVESLADRVRIREKALIIETLKRLVAA
jgi:phosphoribosylglycinamide formyltransferase-1